MYSVFGARLPMSRCQLSTSKLQEDESSGQSHKIVQTKNQRWLPHLQAAYRFVLLSC